MGLIVFECLKCGTCCKTLFDEYKGMLMGLALTTKERELFPSDLVFPSVAFGKKKPKNIVIYQLDANVCPFLNSENRCEIHHNRPLSCRAFPLELNPPKVSNKCQFFKGQIGIGEFREIGYTSDTEFEAANKIEKYLNNRNKRYRKKGIKTWRFDLRTKTWRVYSSSTKLYNET